MNKVLKNPNNIAVIFKDEKLTYEELDKKIESICLVLNF